MLTRTEADACRRILQKLHVEEIRSVILQIHNGRKTEVLGKSEGIEAILKYTTSPLQLLKRKKIRRDLLFIYLNETSDKKEMVFRDSSKMKLILEVLKRWGSDCPNIKVKKTGSNLVSELLSVDISRRDISPQKSDVEIKKEPMEPEDAAVSSQLIDLTEGAVRDSSSQNLAVNHNQGTPFIGTAVTNISSTNTAATHVHTDNDTSNTTGVDNSDITYLGEKFVHWYYNILNSHCPTPQCSPLQFGPQHFWDDCRLIIRTWTPNPSEEEFRKTVLISERLLHFPKTEYLFNPNLTRERLIVKSNMDGLVEILVCGTIHRRNDCLGVFQQFFGIMKDLSDHGNWKIKMSKLYLQMHIC